MAEKKLTAQEQIEELQRKLAALEGELAEAKADNKEASARAAYFAGSDEETPTGRKVKVKRCKNPYVKNADDQVWEEVEVPTFFYAVNMPPVGGVQILLDGEPLYHGQTYEMTRERLNTVKEIVFRLRAHEAAIHGSDEDKYRPRISKEISLRSGSIRNLPPNWMPGAR